LLDWLAQSCVLDRTATRAKAKNFSARIGKQLDECAADYSLVDKRLPNYFIVVSMARFADNWYNLRESGVSIIGLGNWKRSMAPPTILEFIQTLVVREAVASVCPALRGSVHLGSRGCICDFTSSIEDARLKVLNGFLCSYCREKLEGAGLISLADEVNHVLARKWIGDLRRSTSVASILAKLGVNLFVTKGLSPTWHERVVQTIQEDGSKEIIKLLFAVVLAGLLFYLGWNAKH
jgi:hypothetical protein